MPSFRDLYQRPTAALIKTRVTAICVAFGLRVTDWILGSPSERWLEVIARAIDAFVSGPTTAAIRMMFLDLATDPGDPGDLSADQTPRVGFLSALGEGWYGTTRGGATRATTFVTIRNAGAAPTLPFGAFDLTFTTRPGVAAKGDGGRPTYRNSSDESIYTGLGSTITLASGASLVIPIICEQTGSYGTQSIGDITVLVTQSFGSLDVTLANAAIGAERESAALYRVRCRQASTAASPNGASDAYRYAATTAGGGAGLPLQRHDGSGQVGITRVYTSNDSEEGTVTCYFADADGAADAVDVESANANIEGFALGSITNPIGVVPDAVTYEGFAALTTSILVTGTARIRAVPGVDSVALKAAAEAAILVRLGLVTIPAIEIGGVDQVDGAGVIYRTDITSEVKASYPGLYGEALTSPAVTTAIAIGHVPIFDPLSTVVVTVVP
jgi:hypothetical protein